MSQGADRTVLDLIGNTPLLRIRTFDLPRGVELYAKAEWFNPGGSVKDRPALRMIEDAEREGRLGPGRTIIDATSGNTGIAYALVGAVKGYPVELVMPANVSDERKGIIAAYGARVHWSDPLEGSDGAQVLCARLVEADSGKYFCPGQYVNPSNPLAHYDTTAPEIWRQTEGRVTHFVAGIGTSGTIMGTLRRLRELRAGVRGVAVEPEPFHGIEGLKNMDVSIVPAIWDPETVDAKIVVATEDAYEMARRLAREEGIFAGQSSGAALHGALEIARSIDEGVVVTVFPDGGDKYLTTSLWRPDAPKRKSGA
jgi:cysteine synthase B